MTEFERGGAPVADTQRGARRLLAPEFAHGGMLLLIVLSNTAFFPYAGDYTNSTAYPEPSTVADSVVRFPMLALLDVRVYPPFAFLVGYGIVQTSQRRTVAGTTDQEATAMVQRRNRWLLLSWVPPRDVPALHGGSRGVRGDEARAVRLVPARW